MLEFDTEEFLVSVQKALDIQAEKLTQNMDKALHGVLYLSNQYAPINTGEMIDNSGVYVKQDKTSITGYVGYMEFYSIYVHQGTGIYAINGDGRQTPWWWKGTTEKWKG